MLVALPLVTFLGVWASLAARSPETGLARSFLRAAIVLATWTALTTELLSLVHGITRAGLAIAWGLPAILAVGWYLAKHRPIPLDTLRSGLPRTRDETVPAAAIAGILIVTAVVAWAAPPQTWDSLNYHMSRVAHWAQNRSVEPFATGIEQQNSRSPGAEFGVLHLYVLAGSDRWVNFVSWGAFAGLIVAAYVLARQAGIGRDGRWLAAVYTATLPMGLVQASSTMTDAVAALWVAAAAVEVLGLSRPTWSWKSPGWIALPAALAILTKPTTFPVLVPLALWCAGVLWRRWGPGKTVFSGVAAVSLILLVNGGHWVRSTSLYGDPISGGDQLNVHANQLPTIPGQLSNVLRNASLHLGTPSPQVNFLLTSAVLKIHEILGVNPNDPRSTAHGLFRIDVPTTGENTAGNPAHAYLALAALAVFVLRYRSLKSVAPLALTATIGFWLFSTIFKWQIFGARYHVVFFVLMAPVVAGTAASWAKKWLVHVVEIVLLVACIPWLISIRSRPLVPDTDEVAIPIAEETSLGSVLVETRPSLLLASAPYLLRPYQEMTTLIEEASCNNIGMAIFGNSAEYPFWYFLGFPRTDRHIEWIVEGSPSASYLPSSFAPCAVICEGCGQDAQFRALPRVYSYASFALFLRSPDG